MDDDQSLATPGAQRELNAEAEQAALHKRAKQVFLDLIEHPEAEHPAVLDRLCQGDAALREEVASLLVHHRHDSLIPAAARGARSSAGSALLTQPQSPIGKRIGGILVEREVGEGGMSTVYLGHDARLGRRVALKALRSRSGFDRETRSRFLLEARVLSRLKHANICEIYGYEETADGDYLILEYIDGQSLRDVSTEALPLRERDRIAVALADALQVAHSAGVVHRDLKPENVMLTREGQVKVLDFGIARLSGWDELAAGATPLSESPPSTGQGAETPATDTGPLTRNGRILGTLHYMSPEQARGEPISPASDVFSLALLLYELYLGRSVHPGDLPSAVLLERVQKGVVAPLEGLSRARKRLLQRMLSTEPASRPTMTEVAQALKNIRDRRTRLLFRSAVAAVLAMVILAGVNYVLEVTRAWTQAEAARAQLDALADTLLDDIFNRLSVRDRHVMLERLIRLPLHVMSDLPDRLLRESLFRFAERVGTAGRMRLLTGDTLGAQTAFSHMLWLDELAISGADSATLRRKVSERLSQVASESDGCADPGSALLAYKQASAFYEQGLARGRDTERWRARLALVSIPLGLTYLQSANLPAARASIERALTLYDQLQRESTGSKQRLFRYLSAQLLRTLAKTEYYANHLDAALDAANRSIRSYELLARELPYVPDVKANLVESYLMLGRIFQARGDMAATFAALETSRLILTPLHEADPNHSHLLTLLALRWLMFARLSRQRGELSAAEEALATADALTASVTVESLLIAQDARAQALLELGHAEKARPLVEHLLALGWQNDETHRDFAKLAALRGSK